jgi:S-DNA-T family DNA segregation ATPase FtsK/SpoIIIE
VDRTMTLGEALARLGRGTGYVSALAGVSWLTWPWCLAPAGAVVVLAFGALLWSRLQPVSFSRAAGCLRGWMWRRAMLRDWDIVCRRCGLAEVDVPSVRRSHVAFPHVELQVRPSLGQTTQDFEAAAEAMRTAVGASRVRVEACGTRDLVLTFTVGDPLRLPFDARPLAAINVLDVVPMGRREDGSEWRLALGPHTLVAGTSGSGKGSVFWSFAFGLAPAIHSGQVQLHGIDLKGGMEVLMGRGLFTTSATSTAEAVAVLELLVGWMQERAHRYAGRVRAHAPSNDEPLHVVMIDELAALTAYCPERDLQRRAETAINLLCSQGRAPGFMVFACLQDPRKEVIPSRGLFTQMVGLRLKDVSETSMVLGETAILGGAHCHRISRDVPGTGYVLPEEGGHPIRVRAGFASDRAIRDVAERYATPSVIPVVAVGPDPQMRQRRTRSSEVAL